MKYLSVPEIVLSLILGFFLSGQLSVKSLNLAWRSFAKQKSKKNKKIKK